MGAAPSKMTRARRYPMFRRNGNRETWRPDRMGRMQQSTTRGVSHLHASRATVRLRGRNPAPRSGTMQDVPTKATARPFKWVGTRPVRPDGVPKVTGRALFGADLAMPGMLVGRVLRSPHAHARIRSIDTSKAAALGGVKAVVTSADFPEQKFEYV